MLTHVQKIARIGDQRKIEDAEIKSKNNRLGQEAESESAVCLQVGGSPDRMEVARGVTGWNC